MSLKSDLIVQVAVPIATALVEQLLTKENCQQAGDRLIDALEELVDQADSPTLKAVAIPALAAIRKVAQIPDFPDATQAAICTADPEGYVASRKVRGLLEDDCK